ncbi:hypothetical protein [Methanotorris formicicus]|uniref:Uncharacterized protein n=1 Tax=Methanotorris formicicus Mc-S-70 TaxID=647171 RepID=H1KYD3_9EURY|nr:hypothetical protein [Methanotorris formicicus]EHP87217.1 hypothetical protein MetfoDRAFT_0806 [Methanotorris formicicus Mc-S-70]
MKIIYNSPEDFLTEKLWLIPTIRENTLELNENGDFKVVNNISIIRTLATPSLRKTISRLIYLIKDKMTMFKNIEKANWLKNLFNYIYEKYFDKANNNYYRAKKAWYRMMGDLFEDINNWNFKKVRGKVISLLKVLNPILVFDVHNITKWNHTKTFVKFIEELTKNDIVIIIRCPIEAIDYAKKLFKNAKINTIAAVRYYAKLLGYYISNRVAKYLAEISKGNLNIIRLILMHSKKELKTLRDIKIPWLKILPKIVPKKYEKIMEIACELKRFKVKDIEKRIDLKLPTIYEYLNDLVDMGIISKTKIRKTIRFSIKLDREKLIKLLDNLPRKPILLLFSINNILEPIPRLEKFRVFG